MISYDEALIRVAERTLENRQQLNRMKQQRRVSFEDLYGIPFHAQGDANNPATFYVSISPAFEYYEQFAFKFVIEPFTSSVTGVSSGSMTIGETSLEGGGTSSYIIDGTSTLEGSGSGVTPNPHTHSASGSLSGLSYGVKKSSTTSTNWRVRIHGVDITPYLIAQHDGSWITGEGVFPSLYVENSSDFYDILDVACVLEAEGNSSDREKLLVPEFKKVEVISDQPFGVTAYLYLGYSHMNR